MRIKFYEEIFEKKYLDIISWKIRPVGVELLHVVRTDRHEVANSRQS